MYLPANEEDKTGTPVHNATLDGEVVRRLRRDPQKKTYTPLGSLDRTKRRTVLLGSHAQRPGMGKALLETVHLASETQSFGKRAYTTFIGVPTVPISRWTRR